MTGSIRSRCWGWAPSASSSSTARSWPPAGASGCCRSSGWRSAPWAYCAVALIDYKLWLKYAHWVYVACLVPLLLLWTPLGVTRLGASAGSTSGRFRSNPLKPRSLACSIMSASLLTRSEIGTIRESLQVLGNLALAAGLPILLILLQPDLGSALVIPPMVFALLYVSKLSPRFFAAALGAFRAPDGRRGRGHLALSATSWTAQQPLALRPTRAPTSRTPGCRCTITSATASSPSSTPTGIDPMGIGWNLNASRSSRSAPAASPARAGRRARRPSSATCRASVAHNDFIFSVIAEEKGFLGSITVLGLFGVVLFERHPHRRSRPRPLRHAARHRRHRAVRGACVREHRHDHRAGAHHGHTASLHQLRWLLCAQLLLAARTGPERLSLPEGFLHDHAPPSRDIDRFAGISCAATTRPKVPRAQPTTTPTMSDQPPTQRRRPAGRRQPI